MARVWILLCLCCGVSKWWGAQGSPSSAIRRRRGWGTPPITVTEGDGQGVPRYLRFVISDISKLMEVTYVMTGEGVDQPPLGVFSMDPKFGRIYQQKVVDREEIPTYTLKVQAYDEQGNALETPFDLVIHVKDINDNAPQFSRATYPASVTEGAAKGTFVVQVMASDRDEPGTPATALVFRLISQHPQGTDFRVNPADGVIRTNSQLDRETVEYYALVMEVADNNGDGSGWSSTATVSITVADINDNAPKVVAKELSGEVDENTKEVVVGRVRVSDADKVNTSAWRGRYTIVRGNEGGQFRVDTDPVTNEGVITLIKPLDFEKVSSLKLAVLAENEVPFVGPPPDSATIASSMAKFTLRVRDVDERPVLTARHLDAKMLEGVSSGGAIATMHAVAFARPDGPAQSDIRYGVLSDPAGWLIIDPKTGAITTKRPPDRESPFVVNNTYMATFIAVDPDSPGGTSTSTLTIQLDDANDNPPALVQPAVALCDTGPNYVKVTANDSDSDANGAPFTFEIPTEAQETWAITETDGVSAIVKYRGGPRIPRGLHSVPVHVSDRAGLGATRTLNVSVCPCGTSGHPEPDCVVAAGEAGKALGSHLSDGAIAGILAGLLGLLLAAILLLCCCCKRGKSAKSVLYSLVDAPHSSLSTWTKGEEVDKVPIAGAVAATSLNAPNGTQVAMAAGSRAAVQESRFVSETKTFTAANEARAAHGSSAAAAAMANGGAAMRTEQGTAIGLGSAAHLTAAAAATNDGAQRLGGWAGALGGTGAAVGGMTALLGGDGAALESWPITTLGSSGFRAGVATLSQENRGWVDNEHSEFASMGLASEGILASAVDRRDGAFAGASRDSQIYSFMAESLRIMDSDSSNAAADSLLIYSKEGQGGSLLSLSCSEILPRQEPL
ncbi:cadherin-4-like isoform X1 [Lethenteron reissneri]|uniref:cadherin-4-like isoform X1 n=1 Tax=Lethenteron reissneri TaxID=7753 RepID=UPI002AB69D52|nr:cadherin-4-like isoform X1 [Lethenteron reissneri]